MHPDVVKHRAKLRAEWRCRCGRPQDVAGRLSCSRCIAQHRDERKRAAEGNSVGRRATPERLAFVLGRIMAALEGGPKTAKELDHAIGRPRHFADALASGDQIGMIEHDGERWALKKCGGYVGDQGSVGQDMKQGGT